MSQQSPSRPSLPSLPPDVSEQIVEVTSQSQWQCNNGSIDSNADQSEMLGELASTHHVAIY